MDKLTGIKIKYENQSMSAQIPIGVLAKNVEWDKTHKLSNILGNIDISKGDLQSQINQLFNKKINSSQIDDILNNHFGQQIATNVTDWLNDNVNPTGSAVMVDSSLIITGAAADAKVTGDEISELKNDVIVPGVTRLIPDIPSDLPTGWNTGQYYYYLSDRVIPEGTIIKSVKIGTNVDNDGSIVFINDANKVIYKYSTPCVSTEWNVFDLDLLATEDLRIAVYARASWMISNVTADNAFASNGLWISDQTNVDVGDIMTFTQGSQSLFKLAVQWKIQTANKISAVVSRLAEDVIDLQDDVTVAKADLIDLQDDVTVAKADLIDLQDDVTIAKADLVNLTQLIADETTTNKETKLIPNIPSTLPTNWNTGQPYYYLSDRVIPEGALIKNVKIGTNVENSGSIVFINDDNVIVYKYPASCVTGEWNIFEINAVANEDLRIAVYAKASWMISGVTEDSAFASNGLWSSSQLDVDVGDTMTFTQGSSSLYELAIQWEIETGERVSDTVSTLVEDVEELQDDVTTAKADLIDLKQLIVDETTASNKVTKLIPNIPSALPTNWNIGQDYYYLSDRIIPKGADIKSVKIGTQLANDGAIVFINDDNEVVYKYSKSFVTTEWNVFELDVVANEDLRLAVHARASWMMDPIDPDSVYNSTGLWQSDQLAVDVGDTMTFVHASQNLFKFAIQWEIEIDDSIKNVVAVLAEDSEDLKDNMADLQTDVLDLNRLIVDETTVTTETKLIPNIPSALPTNWNNGQSYYYLSDRVIPEGSLIKSVKIGTNINNNGSIVFINDDNEVVYKYSKSCVSTEWNIFELNLVATEDLRIAVYAKASWLLNPSVDSAFATNGLWSSSQLNADIGDTMTFSQASTSLYALAVQWEFELKANLKDFIPDLISGIKSERPVSGYENFSVSVNYSDYTSNGNDSVSSYADYGVVALPTTYKSAGTPTKLIILCGGSGQRIGSNTNPLSFQGWEYYLAKGYAVMDVNGVSTAWASAKGVPNTGLHYCNKFLLDSYSKGYEYVTKKYNVTKSVFIAGISMGGGAAALITQSNIIPVIANAFFCPALSVYKQDYMAPWGGTNQQITIAGYWDFPNWSTTTPSQAYFLENIEKIKGFDNLLIRTIGDHQTANANFGNEAEANAYNSMQKIYPVPIKIWHCEDDALVPFRYSQFMVNMIRNGGGQAWLRSYTTGGHVGGWDTGSITDAGVTTSIPFYESILFFNRFG